MNTEMEELLIMKLHDVIRIEKGNMKVDILRVPNGWIYTIFDEEGWSSVFVPFVDDPILE